MLEIEKAEGVYMYDTSGNKIIDLISGIGVSNVGHCHPEVVQAVKDQAERYMHLMVYGEFVQTPQVKLAEKLAETLPSDLSSVYFVNSGTEAVEGAIKLAKRFTGRPEIVAFKNAYHGSTHGSLSLIGNENFRRNYRPLLPGITHISLNNLDDLKFITRSTAAVIIEPIQGEAGIRPSDENFLSALREKCTQTGTLLIADEIQSGFGRTGKFWGFQHYPIVPDIVVAAKGMGGGMPIGAFISSPEIMHVLTENPVLGHITTFGGHPVSCAASLATLNIIQDEDLPSQVPAKEALFRKLLVHPSIRELRSKGLMMAAEFESFEVLKPIIDRAISNGVLTDWFLFCDNSMRIAPPLTITSAEIEEACNKILGSI
jgi:acetylornithine/succinyldiaminopimelate/putrescine aminotransferase